MNDLQKIIILSRIQSDIETIQRSGHWEQLQDARMSVINLIIDIEGESENEKIPSVLKTKAMIYDGSLAKRKAP